MKNTLKITILASTLILSACGASNNYIADKTKTIEYYRIYDIKTSLPRSVISKAASDGLGRNVNNVQEATPIPSSGILSDTPGRFNIVNPFQGSSLAALANSGGNLGLRVATCEGAVWTAKAKRTIAGSSDLTITACLFQYKGGYHLDQYAVFAKKEGGLFQVSRDLANTIVGSPEEWTEKTLLDVVRNIHQITKSPVTLLEAQPEISGTPWLDNLDAPSK